MEGKTVVSLQWLKQSNDSGRQGKRHIDRRIEQVDAHDWTASKQLKMVRAGKCPAPGCAGRTTGRGASSRGEGADSGALGPPRIYFDSGISEILTY